MSSLGHSAVGSAPLVSVSITAFNSERWLARALDSVLLQKTSFPIEIVIGDDCSTDATVAVARLYEQQNPNLIRVLEQGKNLGMQRNYYQTFEQCRGKFTAWLDADDYWTDPEKLAVQVHLLESDPSINACGHFVRVVAPDEGVVRERYPPTSPGRYGLAEIIQNNFLPSPSILFRSGIHRGLPPWYFDLAGLADWPILLLAGLAGDIVLLDRVMADYTLSSGSAYFSKGSVYRDTMDVRFCECMEDFLPPQWRRLARATKGKRYESMAYLLRKQGDFAASREAAFKAFGSPDLTDNFASKIKSLLAAVLGETLSKLRRGRAAP
jgi:glycosyltransferase involved in cell wall biosynthesis